MFFAERATKLEAEYGLACVEEITSEPDGNALMTNLDRRDLERLPAGVRSLLTRRGASAGGFTAQNVQGGSSLHLYSSTVRRGELGDLSIVAEGPEMVRYESAGQGNARWELVESQILYPCHSDTTPRLVSQ